MLGEDVGELWRHVADAPLKSERGQVQAKAVEPSERVMIGLGRDIASVQKPFGKQ